MTLWPVIGREMRVRAHDAATYWTRCGVALVGACVCLVILLAGGGIGSPMSDGTIVFEGLVITAFVAACGGCLLTADTISSERREGTLGLLFLTRVRFHDVLIGKLGSTSVIGFLGLAAFLPILMIPVLAGGVTAGEVLRKGVALLNTLFLSLTIGLWASAASRKAATSVRVSLLVLAGIVLIPTILASMVSSTSWGDDWITIITGAFSPLVAFITASDTNYSSTPQRLAFWFSLIVVQVLAWSFLLLSQRRLRRALQEVDIKTGPRSEQRALMNVVRSRMFLWKGDPVQWLVIRDRAATNLLWMVAAIEVGYYAFSWASVHGLIFDWQPEVMWPVWGLADLVTDALIAAAAWRFFFEARRKGILEILLTTPLGAGRIIKNQWQALKKKMRWPIAVALSAMLVNSVAMADAFSAPGAIEALPISWVLELATVLTGIGAVCWLAMYFAVKGHTHTGILVRTLGLATGIPAVFRTICLFGLQSWRTVPPGNDFWSQFPAWAEEAIVATYFVALWLFGRGRLEWTLSGRECIKTQRTLSFTSKSIQTVRRTTQPYP